MTQPALAPPAIHDPCECWGVRADLVGSVDGTQAIVELKTGKKLQDSYALQLAAQALAIGGDALADSYERVVVQLRSDGTFVAARDLHRYECSDDYNTVRAAARVAHWKLRHRLATFSEDHEFALHRRDGTRVPGIGTVLKLAGLVDLSAIPPEILARAATLGQHVHRMIELYEQGQLDTGEYAPGVSGLHPKLRPYLDSYLAFKSATSFVVEHCEYPAVYECGG